eukprot:scaffold6529_cov121-Isochrysis_galbana.AAC.4
MNGCLECHEVPLVVLPQQGLLNHTDGVIKVAHKHHWLVDQHGAEPSAFGPIPCYDVGRAAVSQEMCQPRRVGGKGNVATIAAVDRVTTSVLAALGIGALSGRQGASAGRT